MIIAWNKEEDTQVLPLREALDGEWSKFPSGIKKTYRSPQVSDPLPITQITKRSFMNRLTQPERIAIRNSTDDIVIDIYEDLKIATYVDISLPETEQGLMYLVSVGLLESGRVSEILLQGNPEEAYT